MFEHVAIPLLTLWVAGGGLPKASAGADADAARTDAPPALLSVVPKMAFPISQPVSTSRPAPAPGATPPAAGDFEGLMALGAAAVSLMLLCRSQQARYPAFAPGTVVGAVLAGAYGFLQGAWPLGVALGAYAVVSAVRLWLRPVAARGRSGAAPSPATAGRGAVPRWGDPSRRERMFGRS